MIFNTLEISNKTEWKKNNALNAAGHFKEDRIRSFVRIHVAIATTIEKKRHTQIPLEELMRFWAETEGSWRK